MGGGQIGDQGREEMDGVMTKKALFRQRSCEGEFKEGGEGGPMINDEIVEWEGEYCGRAAEGDRGSQQLPEVRTPSRGSASKKEGKSRKRRYCNDRNSKRITNIY